MKTQRLKTRRDTGKQITPLSKHAQCRAAREEHRASPGILGFILRMGYEDDFEPPNEPQPTGARCGSLEKLQVLAGRVLRGEYLYHPMDNATACTYEEWKESMAYCSRTNQKQA